MGLLAALVGFSTVGAEVKDEVAQIRQWYGQIQDDKSLKKVVLSSDEDGPETAEITRFTNAGGELKKLHTVFGGEHGVENATYYFQKGVLFFVYVAHESWHFTGERGADGQDEAITHGGQLRFYYAGGKCIRALQKRAQTKDGSKLDALLKEAKNEPIVKHDSASKYLKKSKRLVRIKTPEELEKFLSGS